MKVVHLETVCINFSEEEIIELLQEKVRSRYYKVAYENFNIKSCLFGMQEDGTVSCEMMFEKSKCDTEEW